MGTDTCMCTVKVSTAVDLKAVCTLICIAPQQKELQSSICTVLDYIGTPMYICIRFHLPIPLPRLSVTLLATALS